LAVVLNKIVNSVVCVLGNLYELTMGIGHHKVYIVASEGLRLKDAAEGLAEEVSALAARYGVPGLIQLSVSFASACKANLAVLQDLVNLWRYFWLTFLQGSVALEVGHALDF
jgi:hypothetical protein